ncbi:MAG: hypothetical protein H7Y11_07485, partial [Armatimonadetes bacterium]|nr:hypothetical protein [Anaerolineae bacterium]
MVATLDKVEAERILSDTRPMIRDQVRRLWQYISTCWRDGWMPTQAEMARHVFMARSSGVILCAYLEGIGVVYT